MQLTRKPATAKPADKALVHGALSLPDERALVLVVDDERINREILSRMLSGNGHNVLTADSGKAALERLEEQLPDLILLDVIMSGMSGRDVLKEIRSRYPDSTLPVIMVATEADRENVIRAFEEGANDCLLMPLDSQITLARISVSKRPCSRELRLPSNSVNCSRSSMWIRSNHESTEESNSVSL